MLHVVDMPHEFPRMLMTSSSLSRFSTGPGWWPECISFAASPQEVRALAPELCCHCARAISLRAPAFPSLPLPHPSGCCPSFLPLPSARFVWPIRVFILCVSGGLLAEPVVLGVGDRGGFC